MFPSISPAFAGRLYGLDSYRFRSERELRPDDLDPDDEPELPPDGALLTLRLPSERETLRDPEEEREGVDTRPEDRDDSEDRDTLPEDRDDPEDGRDDTVPEDRDDDRDTSPDDLVDEPDRSDRPGEVSPLPRGVLSVDDLGYHSTPPGVLVIVRVVRSERPNVSDRVVDRFRGAAREVFDRSTVRPPSVYLDRPVSAVLVLTLVACRVGVVERVELLDPTVVPEEPPTPLRPTRTPRSTVSPSR